MVFDYFSQKMFESEAQRVLVGIVGSYSWNALSDNEFNLYVDPTKERETKGAIRKGQFRKLGLKVNVIGTSIVQLSEEEDSQ